MFYITSDMKVCLINNLFKPYSQGGAERAVLNKAKKLRNQGHRSFVITTKPWQGWGSWRPEAEMCDGVKVYRFWSPNLFWYKNLNNHGFLLKLIWHIIDIFNILSAKIVSGILRKEQPDMVNTHNIMGLGFLIPRVIKRLDTIFVHTLHDVQLVEPSGILPHNHIKDTWYQKIYSHLMRLLFGSPDKVISPSKFLRDFYSNRGFFADSRWQIDKFTLTHTKSIQAQNVEYSRIIKFIYVGALEQHKGLPELMEAWDEYISAGKELRIAGSGTMKQEIRNWANYRQRTKVYGRVERERLERMYSQSDVLIFPSVCIENSPNVIKEALRHDLFVVAARTGGVAEFEDYNIWFFEPGNIEDMRKKIVEVSRNVLIKRGLQTEKKDQDSFEINWANYFTGYLEQKFNTKYKIENNDQQNSDVDVFAVPQEGAGKEIKIQLTQIHPEFFYEKIGKDTIFKGNRLSPTNQETTESKIRYLVLKAIEKKLQGYSRPNNIVLLLQGYFEPGKIRSAFSKIDREIIENWEFAGIYYVFPGLNQGEVVEIKGMNF
ncbi:MAG: glycosyltransferase [Candidatus Paceibacteria bacterium]